MKENTREITLCGMMAALAAAIMCVDSVFTLGLFICPMFAALAVAAAQEESRPSYAWCCFAAAAVLSALLCADKECAALFCFLGYYPLIQTKINNRLPSAWLRIVVKAVFFLISVSIMYALLLFVFAVPEIRAEMAETGLYLTMLTALMGAALFIMYDRLLVRFRVFYREKRKKAHKEY